MTTTDWADGAPREDGDTLTYRDAKEMARHDDPAVRYSLAQRSDAPPEILFFLSADASPSVRRAIAENAATPHQAHVALANDADGDVRSGLAAKLARVLPDLPEAEREKVRRSVFDSLSVLALDQLTRVRQVVAETLKDVADAPSDVINRLARDSEIVVAGPVLEFSPVLTEEDLEQIIHDGPVGGGLNAIARRNGLSERIADTVVGTDHDEAVADLLRNESAQIRETTLDLLIDRAPPRSAWHHPLVCRPHLPAGAAKKLALFVADNLLQVLLQRQDLDRETLEAVREVVHRRLGDSAGGDGETAMLAPDFIEAAPPVSVARRLKDAGRMDANMIVKALLAADFSFVVAALMVCGDMDEQVVKQPFAARNAKGIVALTWKAGLSPNIALQVQQKMARLPPDEVIGPSADGDFALSVDEMTWQLEFFTHASRRGTI